jgi:hypothetical protein
MPWESWFELRFHEPLTDEELLVVLLLFSFFYTGDSKLLYGDY